MQPKIVILYFQQTFHKCIIHKLIKWPEQLLQLLSISLFKNKMSNKFMKFCIFKIFTKFPKLFNNLLGFIFYGLWIKMLVKMIYLRKVFLKSSFRFDWTSDYSFEYSYESVKYNAFWSLIWERKLLAIAITLNRSLGVSKVCCILSLYLFWDYGWLSRFGVVVTAYYNRTLF